MNRRRVLHLASLLALVFCLGAPNSAAAFCRSTTVDNKRSCEICETRGFPLAWSEPGVEYLLQESGFPGLSEAEVRDVFAQAFARWQSVSCNGQGVEFDVQAAPETSDLKPREETISPSANVLGYLSADEWIEQDYSRFVFAQTNVRYYKGSGVIAGADIWFNGGIGDLTVCPDEGCDIESGLVDLPNVATHEIGHFLGLAHSKEAGATMACSANPGVVHMRSLEQDDRDGLCAIYPPGIAFRGAYRAGAWTKTKRRSACSLAPSTARPSATLSALALIIAAAFAHRRRAGRAA